MLVITPSTATIEESMLFITQSTTTND
jgi:hypothetical protein